MKTHAIAIVTEQLSAKGLIHVSQGRVTTLKPDEQGRCTFRVTTGRCVVTIADAIISLTAPSTIVKIDLPAGGFSFFLRDVSAAHPILIPAYGVAITEQSDKRSYAQILASVAAKGLVGESQQIENDAEETYENAAENTYRVTCETWLGLSRDMRLFTVAPDKITWFIRSMNHGLPIRVPASLKPIGTPQPSDERNFDMSIGCGRGIGPVRSMRRWLDQGVLPILHGRTVDGEIAYESTFFCTLERSRLKAENIRGTHYAVAHGHGLGAMFTPAQQQEFDKLKPQETVEREEQTVLMSRTVAINTGASPCYAFYRTASSSAWNWDMKSYDPQLGANLWKDRVGAVTKVNGVPMCQPEISVLLPPGGRVVFEMVVPHEPMEKSRGAALLKLDFESRLEDCRSYWKGKLAKASSVTLPDKRINEMVRAGLLHLDLVTYGLEPDGPTAATIGHYSPIGSESAPIILFFDAMGWHDVARRSIQFFLARQHENGFIQNFGGYMLETGPALWCIAEHYLHTRDKRWLRSVGARSIKAAEYLLAWRERNKRPELHGKGYGLIEGKVADPEDHFRQYMLNAYSVMGVTRLAQVLAEIGHKSASRLKDEARAWNEDLRADFARAVTESPVIPLGDGTWAPTAPPWAESRGPQCLFTTTEPCFTHGTFTGRDSLIGPLYLLLAGVIDPRETLGDFLMRSNQVLFNHRNAAFSQPYYARHDYGHLLRGEVKAYLKMYFNQVAALADRETYTFWEHYFGVSPHKTHEEAWFLMQTRWMLWHEQGDRLDLLSMIPRIWLSDTKTIRLDNVASHFGPISLDVQSDLSHSRIDAEVTLDRRRGPQLVSLRLPHPDGQRAIACEGGEYDATNERVLIQPRAGRARVTLKF